MDLINKGLLAAATAGSVMLLTACGGGSSGSSSTPASTAVSGGATKGIVIDGLVDAYRVTSAGAKGIKLADQTRTDARGQYSLTLNSDYQQGEAILVEITADAITRMKCDLSSCAAGVSFGDLYDVDDATFMLTAVLPGSSNSTVSVNITPLTHAAAKTTLARVANGAAVKDAAQAANVQIANRLGIEGSLLDLPIVDITDAASINAADTDAFEANLKASGAIAALLGSGQSIEQAVASFASQFENGGLADTDGGTDDPAVLTLEELLGAAQTILGRVKQINGVNSGQGSAVASTETEVASEETAARSGSTQVSQGETPDDLGSEGLVAAKSFVRQLRDLANASGFPTDGQRAFADQLALVDGALDGNVEPVAQGLGIALVAIAEAWSQVQAALQDDDPGTTPPESVAFEGVTVAVSQSGGTFTYEVDQNLSVDDAEDTASGESTVPAKAVTEVALKLTAVDSTTFSASGSETVNDTGSSYMDEFLLSADLALEGSASSSAAVLAIKNGSMLKGVGDLDESGSESQSMGSASGMGEWNDQGTFELSGVDAGLIVELTQRVPAQAGGPTFSFTGSFDLDIDLWRNTWSSSESWSYNETSSSASTEEIETIEIGDMRITLGGLIASSEGESLELVAAMNLGGVNITCESTWALEDDYANQNFTQSESDSCAENPEEGSATVNPANVAITVIFELDLAGVADDVKVTLNAARTGLQTGTLELDLAYAGKQLNIDYSHPDMDAANYDGSLMITVSNHNNVEMVMTATGVEDGAALELSGIISANGATQANIEQTNDGVVLIRYIDGTTQSII